MTLCSDIIPMTLELLYSHFFCATTLKTPEEILLYPIVMHLQPGEIRGDTRLSLSELLSNKAIVSEKRMCAHLIAI